MRKNTLIKKALIAVMFLLNIISYSQNLKPFTPRYDQDVRGDMFLIGNNILNRNTSTTEPEDSYNGSGYNSDFSMEYIDIDSDASTFSSSSANLASPRPGGDNCYKIVYAGLYWGAILQSGSRTDINKVKFKLPTGGYTDITGQVVYDAGPTPIGGDSNKPYACYADVTSLITPLANPVGTYTVANVLSSEGSNGGTGLSAGWSLIIVYEDPTLTSKSIVTFDGFSGIGGATTLDIPISGFRTIPSGPVRAKFAMTALEGDQPISGDYLRINGNTISTPERAANNFFNSSITTTAGYFTTRNPNSSNTLGYDAGILNVLNPGNAVIPNNATTATIRLGSTQDVYFYFFNAFAVDIIAPEIQLTKDVENALGVPIGGTNVNLGQQLNYEIGFQNIGNDNATSFTITDVLPINVIFNPADLALPGALPPGVTFTFTAPRTLTFTIPNNLVEVGDPKFIINIKVTVVSTCLELDDACSNLIQNQAFATYTGTFNTTVFSDEGSIASFGACGFGTPGSTNFLVDLDDCDFTRTEVICSGSQLTLTAANGYDTYVWSGPGTITPVAGTNNQSVIINTPGTYTVNNNITLSPCKSIVETINVIGFGVGVTNPAIPVADQIVVCPTNNVQLPLIFLCGAGDSQLIQSNIAGAVSISWEQLVVGSCPPVANVNCPNEDPGCSWTPVGTGPNYNVTAAGQYRIVITFQGNCKRIFYFNAYQNLLNPTVTPRDIICTTPGQITVNGVPPGYEYSLTGLPGSFVPSNVFIINTAGIYTVYIQQIGVTGGCLFTVPNVAIQARTMTVVANVTQPLCFGQKGSINLTANGVGPQYTFNIYQEPGHTLVNSIGPIASNNQVFSNLNPGNYSYQVTTQDGCIGTGNFTINNPQLLTVTAALTVPLTCTDGQITIYPVGGTPFPGTPPSYSYFINSTTVFQTTPQYVVTAPGVYNIQVVDANNCTATTSITVTAILPPAFTITKTDIACSGSGNTGSITVNVTNPNGNTLLYSINGAAGPFSPSPVFTNLAAGTYNVVVQYSVGPSVCTSAPQAITIIAPPPIVGTAALTQEYTCEHPGIITVSGVSGGVGPYTYSINGVTFQPGNTFTITSAGTYTITIKDANGCTITRGPIVVPPLDGPRDLVILIHDVITCPDGTGTLNAQLPNTAGGLPPITFSIVSPPAYAAGPQSSGLFHDLPGGITYIFEVEDRNGCTYQESYYFPPLPPFTVVGQVINNVRCIGTSTGNAQFTVSGIPNNTNYSYQINGLPPPGINGTTPATGSTTFVINLANQPAGTYILTIHNNANDCDATATVVITQPATALVAPVTVSPVTCATLGQVVVNASGGWGGYTYVMAPMPAGVTQSGGTFSNIPTGSYVITTTDSGGCSVTTPFTLTNPTPPTASINATSDFCYDGTNAATLVVTASGGVAPYTFSINGGPFNLSNTLPSSYTFSNLTPGSYTITVRDAFGCTVVLPVQTINAQLTVNASLTSPLNCTASPNAVISGTINGGYPPYTCVVNGVTPVPIPVTPGNTFTYSATAGTYQFVVTDSRGCTAQSSVVTVSALVPVAATNTVTNTTCNGLSNGSVTITPSGGTGPYQINFAGAGLSSVFTYGGLAAGTYTYVIVDSRSCTFNGSVTIGQPASVTGTAALTTAFTCTSSGVITVTSASGGTAPYTYSNGGPFQVGTTFPAPIAGIYLITIKDLNGCTFSIPVTVAPLNPPTDLSFSATPLTCPTNTSNLTVTVTGTNAPYLYQIIAPSLIPLGGPQGSNVFTNLAPNTYTVQVTDSKNCTYQENFTIAPLAPMTVVGQLVANVRCFGTSTGAIQFTVGGYPPNNYSYVITGPVGSSATGQTAPVINVNNLPAGTYTIVVTNSATNCTATTSVTVNGPASGLAATLAVTPINCLAPNTGQVVVSATGGWGGYTYTLTPPSGPVVGPQPSNTFSNLSLAGLYTVTTTDSGGCAVSSTFTLTTPVAPTASINVAASDFCYDTTNGATLVVTASGGVAPYTYSYNGGIFGTSNIFANLPPGTYIITVKDFLGCTVTLPAQTIQPQLTITASLTKDLDCTASPNAVISGTIAGGYIPYTVLANNGGGFIIPVTVTGNTFTLPTGSFGTYTFQVTDTRGCTAVSGPVTINPLSLPVITSVVQTTPILCNGDSNAAINVNINTAVGNAPYVINVFNNTTGINYGTQTSGLPAGNYTVTITDAKSCTDTEIIVIGQPALIAYTEVVVPITCSGSGTSFGSISVTGLTGGTAPFTYILTSNVAATQTFGPTPGVNHTFTVLNFGIYELSVVDANGCTVKKSNIIMSSPPTDLNIDISTPTATCAAGGTVIVTVSVFPPGGPYHFAIYQSPYPLYTVTPGAYQDADVPGGLSSTFTGLTPGVTYSFIVYDETTQCYFFKEASGPIPTLSTLTSTINVVNNVTCIGSADANVSFTYDTSDATSVTYQIFNSQTNTPVLPAATVISAAGAPTTVNNVGPLAPGVYYILFTENNGSFAGCSNASVTFTVTQSAVVLSITASIIKNDNCNVNAGQISAVAQGGTAPYVYQIISSVLSAPTAASPGWGATNNVLNAEGGNYIAYVMDAFGCIQSTPVIVLPTDPSPVIAATVTNQCTATQGNFSINVTMTSPGVGPYTYSVDGGTYQPQTAPFLISGLVSGPHTIQVKDLNGCGNLVNVTILAPLGVSPVVTALPSCANNDGVITVNATGGSGTYTYSIAPNPAGITLAGNVFSNVPSGSYTITVTDVTTTCTKDVPVVLGAATPVTFSTTVTNVSCNGSSDGIITVNLPASNNNPPYTYTITAGPAPGIPIGPQSSNVFTGLPAGVYTVVVTSGRGCSLTDATVTITQPAVLTASGSATPFTCAADNSVNTSTVTINGAGGTTTYVYSIDGVNYFTTNTFNIINNGSTQNLTGYVKDAHGCIATTPIVVTPLPTMTSPVVTQNIAITCTNDELVTITVTGGSGNFSYQTLPVGAANVTQVGTTNQFNISAPGTYYFQVNDLTTGCYIATLPYTVAPFNSVNVVAMAIQAVTCFGDSDGGISINVTGYSGAYSYTVLDSANTPVVSGTGNTSTNPLPILGLPAGNYTIQVTETASPFCTIASNSVTVSTPSAPVALALVANINANCNSGAQVTVSGSGGTAPYTYAFVNDGVAVTPADYSTSNTAVLNLPQLLWDVYVMDANGCFTFIDVTIAADPVPTITVPPFAADQCTSTGASYTFTATGTGVPPLTYSIGTGFQPTGVFTVTTPGTYTVTVKDGNGCTVSDDIIIYPVLGITPTVSALPSCANNDGVITVNATGGSGVYTYSIAPNPAGITLAGNVFSNVPSGSYTITVTDVTTTCTKDVPVVLSAATPVTFSTTVTNVSCNGSSDGIITVNLPASNDNPPYTYTITAGPAPGIPIGPQSSNVFTGLPAGVYTVVVTSGRGCSLTDATVTITQPAVLTASGSATPFTCAADNSVNTSTVTINGAGGTTPYSYSIDGVNYFPSPNNTFNIIDTHAVQNLTGYIKDANGCIATTPIVVTPLPTMTSAVVTQNIAITCTNDELVTITVTGGSGNVTYQALPIGAANVTQVGTTNQFNISAPGTYYFQVNDLTTGCYIVTLPYIVAPFNTIDVVATATQAVTCFGDSNGAISINVTGYSGAYSYIVLDSANATVVSGTGNTATNPLPISGLSGGNYTVQVTETASPFCVIISNLVTVASPNAPLALNAQETANVTCTNDQGIIVATATGGWGTYEFELVGPVNVAYSSNNVFTNLPAGNYVVNVKDLEGCIATANVTLTVPTPIAATFTATPTMLACFGDSNACITVTNVTGGQGSNYTYTLNNGNPTLTSSGPQVSPVFCGLGAGTYTVTIEDGYNCFLTSANIIIGQPPIVGASLTVASTQTCLTNTVLTLTASGGTPPYFYSNSPTGPTWTPFAGATTTPISVPVGTYSFYVQDSNGCLSAQSNDVTIPALTPLTLSLLSTTNTVVNCFGDTNGAIYVSAQGGLGNYIYTLVNTTTSTTVGTNATGIFANLPAGNYSVNVVSGDCTIPPIAVIITQPVAPLLVGTPVVSNVTCYASHNGSITFSPSGGTAPYQYAISPNLDQFFSDNSFDDLGPGSYTVIVQDANGCFEVNTYSLTEPTEILLGSTGVQNETCFGDNDGEFTINISGGTAPYTITYTPGGPTVVLAAGVTSHTFVDLGGGDYTVTVTDANGCPSITQVPVGIGVLYDPIVMPPKFYCVDNNQPAVRIEVLNLTNQPTLAFDPLSDYMFSLDVNNISNAQPSNIFTSADYPSLLTPGDHSIYVFHVNGCNQTAMPSPFTINAADVTPLTLVLSEGGLNEIIATVTGGSGQYTYIFNGHNNGGDNSYVYDASGTYVVTVTDNNREGCSVTEAIPVVYTPIFIPNVFTPNGNGGNDSWGPTNTSNYKDLVTKIYDRYGRQVAELKEGQFWDGKYEGKELPSGDYWYVIKVDGSNDREYVGHFTLYR